MSDPSPDTRLTVSEIGEHGLIERLRARVPDAPAWVTVGIGDDAAVIEPARGELDVLTTDALVEGIHFRRDWSAASTIGHKALAVNLSDLAAMGASPRGALLSLALPADLPVADFDELIDGFLALAREARVPLIGGNITRSPGPLMLDVTLIGSVRRRRVLTRRGGRDGDELYVTGSLGGAATGLALLEDSGESTSGAARPSGARADWPAALAACVERYERPQPRLRAGINVARNRGASACVDVSDGLADAVRQLAHASGLGAIVDAALVPVDAGTAIWAERRHASGADAADCAIRGGEDYELLFAVPPGKRRRFHAAILVAGHAPVTRIGRLTKSPGLWCERDGRRTPLAGGFTHF